MNGFYIFCDESLKKGKLYSNFYGGLLINIKDYASVNNALLSTISELNIQKEELKWSNVNTFKLETYLKIIDVFFGLIKSKSIKFRVMFTDNRFLAHNLPKNYYDEEYHILYYHFIKHAFGLRYLSPTDPIHLELFFDKLPDKEVKNNKFKKFIYGLQFLPEFSETKINIEEKHIHEVDSKKHILMQCLDIVLGAMAFRLNNMHKEIPIGEKRRGKRTIAKEKLYKFINKKICEIRPNFNIGITTGIDGDPQNRFSHPYRHWLFIPNSSKSQYEESNKKKSP